MTIATTTNQLLDAALQAATWGYRVFPLHWPVDGGCSCREPGCDKAGKHPLIADWPNRATTDPEQIRAWWAEWPEANVAGAMGDPYDALDEDPRHGGDLSFQELEAHVGSIESVTVRTGGGGRHLHFRTVSVPLRKDLGRDLPGLDLKGRGGYVVLPKSRHASGAVYEWELSPGETEFADWPAALLPLIRPPDRAATEAALVEGEREPLPCWNLFVERGLDLGFRDQGYFTAAKILRRAGVDRDEAEAQLTELDGKEGFCRPAFGARGVGQKVWSAYKGYGGIGCSERWGDLYCAGEARKTCPVSIAEHRELVPMPGDEDAPPERGGEEPQPPTEEEEVPSQPRRDIHLFVTARDLLTEPEETSTPLCGSTGSVILPRRELVFLHGKPRTFKSWLSLTLGLAIASGEKWLGTFPCERGRVALLQGDGSRRKWRDRVRKCISGMGLRLDDIDETFLTDMRGGFRLDDQETVDALIDRLGPWRPDLLVLDPLAKFHLADENSTSDMVKLVAALDRITNTLKCSMLVDHHERKGLPTDRASEAMRGSSVLWAAGSTIAVKKVSETECEVSVELKDDEPPGAFAVAVVVDVETATLNHAGAAGSPEQRRNREAVEKTLRAAGEPMSRNELQGATTLTKHAVRTALKDLVETGNVIEAGRRGIGAAAATLYIAQTQDDTEKRVVEEGVNHVIRFDESERDRT